MNIAEAQVKKLLSGEASCKFDQLGFNMMLARLAKNYKSNPSPAVLEESTREINAFIDRFGVIMQQDFAKLQEL